MNDFFAAIEWLMAHETTSDKVGITGFCYGGGWRTPHRWLTPNSAPPCRSMAAGRTRRMWRRSARHCCSTSPNRTSASTKPPAYEAALKAAGKPYEAYIYPGTHHGFHNDSTPRYDEPAAELAWQRTIARFQRHLS